MYSESLSVPSRSECFSEGIQRSASPTPLRKKKYSFFCKSTLWFTISTHFFTVSLNRISQNQDTLLNKPSHTITHEGIGNSVLSLACSDKYLFSGSQSPHIQVRIILLIFSLEI